MRECIDRGLWVCSTLLARQITALPCPLYEIRLVHNASRQAYPGVRRWTASQLLDPATVGFLRIRNRDGYEVYFRPYGGDANAGYILLDLDQPAPGILGRLRQQGHEPSVLVQTSPGKLQAWIRVSRGPLPPAHATSISRWLAQLHAADPASADGRHLGRLAGFANRKPQRRQSDGRGPWVKLIYASACLARDSAALIQRAATEPPAGIPLRDRPVLRHSYCLVSHSPYGLSLRTLYQACLTRLRILERYPSPNWSIVDQWIARELLQTGTSAAMAAAVLRHGSPGFPRRHADPDNYLSRTIYSAARQIDSHPFPAPTPSLD
jgi:hypothetical protein